MSFKRILIFIVVLSFTVALFGSSDDGTITGDMLSKFRDVVKNDKSIIVKRNALTNVDIKSLVRNYDIFNSYDFHFSKKLEMYGVSDQKSTGRCWLFAGLTLMRREIAKKLNLSNFELSHTYNYFYDKMEKANMFLELMITNYDKDLLDRGMQFFLQDPIMDGGQWNMVVELINKYGVVPKSAMMETINTENSRSMLRLINRKLRRDASVIHKMAKEGKSTAELRAEKEKMLEGVYKMLVMHLGEPPAEFIFRYEDKDKKLSKPIKYAPQSFLKEFVKINLADYVMFYNDPRNEYRKLYRIRFDRDMLNKEDLNYINIDIKDMKEMVFKSIMADSPVWFGADVGKQSDRKKGILADGIYPYCKFFETCLCMDKKDRIQYREEIPTHAMVFTGVDVENGKPIKWLVENSWGKDNGENGYFVMYNNWFDEFVLAVVIDKKFIPKDILDILKTEPILLDPWDPMFDILMMK